MRLPEVAGSECCLLVIERSSSRTCILPPTGTLTIGSAAESADLVVSGDHVEAQHARVRLDDGRCVLEPVRPESPIRVNGELLDRPRELLAGDTIGLGTARLVFHRTVALPVGASMSSAAELQRRLVDEVLRTRRYERPVAVIVLDLPAGSHDADRLGRLVAERLRQTDSVAWDGAHALVVLLPETNERAAVVAERLMALLEAEAPGSRAGVACCPLDACDAESLLAAARLACRSAKEGGWASLEHATTRIEVGGSKMLTAEPKMAELYALVDRLAQSRLPVLVNGETGAGKEFVAHALHARSARRAHRFVALNCAALPDALLESELFGHEKGAFSGAVTAKPGLFEAASGGTVFLDEVGELSLPAQAKLLRVLETQRVHRVGGLAERPIDVRVVAATNRRLEDEIAAGRFREDLYYRIGAAVVVLPPLRERPLDLPLLARTFLDDARSQLGRPPLTLSPGALMLLASHAWPGNLRELRNAMDFLAALSDGGVVPPDAVDRALRRSHRSDAPAPESAPQTPEGDPSGEPKVFRNIYDEIRELERTRILEALEATGGHRARAAALIGMPLRTFVTRLRAFGIGDRQPPGTPPVKPTR